MPGCADRAKRAKSTGITGDCASSALQTESFKTGALGWAQNRLARRMALAQSGLCN